LSLMLHGCDFISHCCSDVVVSPAMPAMARLGLLAAAMRRSGSEEARAGAAAAARVGGRLRAARRRREGRTKDGWGALGRARMLSSKGRACARGHVRVLVRMTQQLTRHADADGDALCRRGSAERQRCPRRRCQLGRVRCYDATN
jgi:hypothetical protein